MALEVQQHREEGFVVTSPVTLDLFQSNLSPSSSSSSASSHIDLEEPSPLPLGWQKFLNIKTGAIYYRKESHSGCVDEEMSRNGKNPKLDLKLNLSPPRTSVRGPQRAESPVPSPTSPPTSCVSSEHNTGSETDTLRYSNSPEATSMVLVGCPRCLMYVMLSEEDPKCPKCKSTVLLDFLHDKNKK
eukprot:TRINITY_DN3824_c0_g1_i1.p1 TRINITY_DN3824_c0_g1~~TRINITY_DN3824_c0_g1_i1.p1  ORF type:complete len:216 (+),score=27.69 TRINITY_DN3824_c0_g1_i1:93-650(+)